MKEAKQYGEWVKASDEMPEEKIMEYGSGSVFVRNIQSNHGGMLYISELKKMSGIENIEWLRPVSGVLLSAEELEGLMRGVIIREFDSDKYYWCKCENCGWEDSSQFVEGCHAIADTGDHTDPVCPVCYSRNIEGEETVKVPDSYTGVHKISIPVDVHINAYKNTIDQLRTQLDNYVYGSPK